MDINKIFDGDLSEKDYKKWINQFEDDEQKYINKLIENFNYFSLRRLQVNLKQLYEKILKEIHSVNNTIFVPVGYVVKSGSVVAYFFKKINKLRENHFLPYSELNEKSLKNVTNLVFIDDFIGSGQQCLNVHQNLIEKLNQIGIKPKLIYATIVGYNEGIKLIQNNTSFIPISQNIYSIEDLPFHNNSTFFDNEEERNRAKEIVKKYGKNLYPKYPLGYKGNSSLLGFFYSTPNNTLPIFWSSQNNWIPLLTRGDDYRDPEFLVGPEINIPENLTFKGFEETFIDDNFLDNFNVDANILLKLTQELNNTQLLLIIVPVFKELELNVSFVTDLIKILNSLKSAVHEQQPVSSAIFISKPENFVDLNFYLKINDTRISDTKSIEELANQTTGFDDCIAIDTNGKVYGNFSYDTNGELLNFIPRKLQSATKFTAQKKGLLVLFEGDNKINMLWKGQRLISHRKSSWYLTPSNFGKLISILSTRHAINREVIERIITIAIEMTHIGEGGLITIGDSTEICKISTLKPNSKTEIGISNILELKQSQAINLISQDGASIIDSNGNIIQYMSTLRPPTDIKVKLENGKGTKHQTAQIVSAMANTIAIAISVDSNFTIYSRGEKIYRMNG